MAVLLLSGLFTGTARAQTDESKLPPTDYGAGYKIIMVQQHQEHPLGPGVDEKWGATIKLNKIYPLISSPLTPDAQAYNTYMNRTIPRWWKDIGGPQDNNVAADPDWDISLDCEPVGLPPPTDGRTLASAHMLPGIISMSCGSYSYLHGAAHGGGLYWGLNWMITQHRPITPLDIFTPNSGWLKTLTILANSDRTSNNNLPGFPLSKLDFADSHHWVLEASGLGLTFSDGEYENCECGGMGLIDLIPWSKLAPYLRKDGIVPQSDWSASAAPGN